MNLKSMTRAIIGMSEHETSLHPVGASSSFSVCRLPSLPGSRAWFSSECERGSAVLHVDGRRGATGVSKRHLRETVEAHYSAAQLSHIGSVLAVLYFAARFELGFKIVDDGIKGFAAAFVASLLISAINGALGVFLPDEKE